MTEYFIRNSTCKTIIPLKHVYKQAKGMVVSVLPSFTYMEQLKLTSTLSM